MKKAFIHFYERFRFPFFAAMGSGLLAYVYFFTNKLPNYDDVIFTFSKGYGLASGRWGLELCELIFPNYSMPWLWGIISIVLLSISACLVLDVLEIRNRILGCLAAALIVVFPSEIGTFTYMFTSSSYALSFLFAVLSVHLVRKGDEWWRYAVSGGLIILMLSIYQSYIAITASLFVLLMIADTLRTEKSVKHIIARGIQYLLLMAFSVAAYLLITKVLQNLRAEQYGEYAQDAFGNPQSITERIYTCYRSFLAVFVPNYRMYGLVVSKFAAYLHVAAILISAVSILLVYWKSKKWGRFAFLAALTAVVLPLAMTCMLFVAGNVIVHTLVMYGFSLIYAYFALAVDYGTEAGVFRKKGLQNCLCLALFTILCCNVTESNRAALAMQFEYENTYALYTTIAAQIQSTPGFDKDTKIALVGNAPESDVMKRFGWSEIMGVMGAYDDYAITLRNAFSREEFVKYFLGMDLNFASDEEIDRLIQSGALEGMASYPYYGYIKKTDQYLVVLLSE